MPDDKANPAAARDSSDEPFFREWKRRAPGEGRSVERARKIMAALELEEISIPLLTVVGSKGKATTALYAAAALSAAGLRVGLITSPPLISNRERIRLNGEAISQEAYEQLARRLTALLDARGHSETKAAGYLSPSGLYTLMGMRYFLDQRCDAVVAEAGMGGRSDEVSLFSPTAVAVTSIFKEHADILGPDVSSIALDKIGVMRDATKIVLTLRQSREVAEVLLKETAGHSCPLIFLGPQSREIHEKLRLPEGLVGDNAALGIEAASRLQKLCGLHTASPTLLQKMLSGIKLPGRLSPHVDERGRHWILDAAINSRGIAGALLSARNNFGEIDTVLVCLPAGKDIAGALSVLGGIPFVPVRLETEHLSFTEAEWGKRLVQFDEIEEHLRGERILALGTWSFIGALLKRFGFEYERAYG